MSQRGAGGKEVGVLPWPAQNSPPGPAWSHPIVTLSGLWMHKCSDKPLRATVGPRCRGLLAPRRGSAQWGAHGSCRDCPSEPLTKLGCAARSLANAGYWGQSTGS